MKLIAENTEMIRLNRWKGKWIHHFQLFLILIYRKTIAFVCKEGME